MKTFHQYLIETKNTINGKLYHGSNAIFKQFDQRKSRVVNDYYGGGVSYFTDKLPVAVTYAKSMQKQYGGDQIIYTVTLKLNNCFDVDDVFTGKDLIDILPNDVEEFARGAGLLSLSSGDKFITIGRLERGKLELTGDQVFRGISKGMNQTAKARDYLVSKGYDGLRYNGGEHMNAPRHNVYLAYDAKSIKIEKAQRVKQK